MTSILHVGSIAGVPQELSRVQRRMGYKSDVISFQPHPFKYEVDLYKPTCLPVPLRYVERFYVFSRVIKEYDLLHFHYFSLLPFGIDFPWWKLLGKKVIMHYHGDDIRGRGAGMLHSRFADALVVSTPDLLEWSAKAIWIPNPIDLRKYQYIGIDDRDDNLRILHAPTDPHVKGTEYVVKAVESLRQEGYGVELDLVMNLRRDEAIKHYMQADIVVDQLLIGWYGVFAIECMALGKPVCVYIREDLEKYIPPKALVNTSPNNLKERLRVLIEDVDIRKSVGMRGRRFVEDTHDAEKIARRMDNEVYGIEK